MSERLYRRIAAEMRAAIGDGRWPVGTRLSAEPELAAQFGVSRTTVRQALGELESQGLLDRRKRHGTTVAAREPDGRFRMDTGDLEQLLGLARDTIFTLESTRGVAATAVTWLADLAGNDADWFEIVGTRQLPQDPHERPFSWSWIWVAGRFAAVGDCLGPGTRSVYGVLEREFGVTVTRVVQSVTAVPCPTPVAERLGLVRQAPAIEIVATLFDGLDEPLERTRTLFDPARFQVHSDTRIRND